MRCARLGKSMVQRAGRTVFSFKALLVVVVLGLAACSGGDGGTDPDPDSGGSFLTGEWIATLMRAQSVANPEARVDIIASGGEFTLSVQPSGRYTAILVAFGQSASESGTLSIVGNEVVFNRTFPSVLVTRATWTRSGPNVTLNGPTEFDFNLDGTAEPATLETVLAPR